MRHEFHLPEEDEESLNTRGLAWETILEAGSRWLIVHEYPIPRAYNHGTVSLALLIPPGYPDTEIDMAYFYPPLTNGRSINALSAHRLDGKTWQRWSRHRTKENSWRPGVDGVDTHLSCVDDWLEREVA